MYTAAVILGIIAGASLIVAICAFMANDEDAATLGVSVAFLFGVLCLIISIIYNDDMSKARESREISALVDQTYHVPAHVDTRKNSASFDYQGARCAVNYVRNALDQWELTHPICSREVSIQP